MKYKCTIADINDEEITMKNGILDIDHSVLKSEIDFEINVEELFDYGDLDGKKVKIDTIRIDFDFI